ncbi:conserved hypothetical protein [Ricinus communis]|uniref:OTU domain-containing protein n=1 Tax=Ricinus communis TaxID=3988 RepID=B9S3V4_RICCO|nr:conserved hypothetical protein [Ricinus communis]
MQKGDSTIELKKAAAKGRKAEQKAKQKQVEEQISQLSAKLKEKHAEELASLGYNSVNGNEKSNLDNLVMAIAGVSVANQRNMQRSARVQREGEKELSKKQKGSKEFKKSRATFQMGTAFTEPLKISKSFLEHMHQLSFPSFLSDNATEGDSDDSLTERFQNYCKEVESTSVWGGQLELGALTHCLTKHIKIFSGWILS